MTFDQIFTHEATAWHKNDIPKTGLFQKGRQFADDFIITLF